MSKQEEDDLALIDFGREQGKEQGERIGEQNKAIAVARVMLQRNCDLDLIVEATGLSEETVNSIRDELWKTG